MTVDPSDRDASSISRRKPSPAWHRSVTASSTSASPGRPAARLGAREVRELAARHGVRPSKSLGQHFLIDPNLARAIAVDAAVGEGDRVAEIGAGLGSLTVALAATGAEVLAIEFDRALMPALQETTAMIGGVRLLAADALRLEWTRVLGSGPWVVCANLPYNVAMPLLSGMLDAAPMVVRFVLMVQREAGERLVASPGDPGYGPVALRVQNATVARVLRHVPSSVFWPRPRVESVVVGLERRAAPAVDVAAERLRRVVDAGFAERRKAMRNAVVRLGLEPARADDLLRGLGIDPRARAEQLSLEEFARIAEAMP